MPLNPQSLQILHVIQGMDPRWGGPPVSALELAAAQARCGARVSLLYRSTEESEPRVDVLRRMVRDSEAVEFIGVPKNPSAVRRLDGRGVRKAIGQLEAPPDVLHAHGVWDPVLGQASRALPSSVRRIVATKGMLHPYCMATKTLKKRLAMATLSRGLLSKAHRILALNDEECEAIERRFGRGRGGVLPNGIDLSSLPTGDEAAFRSTCTALEGRPYFVFIGRLNAIKGVDVLVEAFLKVRAEQHDIDLVLVGPDSGMAEHLRAHAASANASNRVHFTGPIYGDGKYDALKGARAFAMPSRYEGWGNAVVEAMAMGTPVVVSPQCHLPRITETETGIVAARTPEAFGAALASLAADEELAHRLGTNARARAIAEFDWSKRAAMSFEYYGD